MVGWFFQEKFRAVGQTFGAATFARVARQDDFFHIRMTTVRDAEQLHAVEQRHADVEDGQVNGVFLQNGQRPIRRARLMNFPRLVRHGLEQLTDRFEERHAVVHEQHLALPAFRTSGAGGHSDGSSVRDWQRRNRRFHRNGGDRFDLRACRRNSPESSGRGKFKAQFNVAELQDFPRLEHRLGDQHAANEGAIRRTHVADGEFVAPELNLAVLAGDGGLDDLEGVAGRASNRHPLLPEAMSQARERRRNDD